MKLKYFFFVSAGILLSSALSAQNDSLIFANANWLKMNVARGITLSRHYFADSSLFSSNQNISILEIDPREVKIDIVGDTVLRTVSSFAEQYDAEAAVNGSFFDMDSLGIPYNSVEYLKIDGKQKAPGDYKKGYREFYQKGLIAFYKGIPYIMKAEEYPFWEETVIAEDAVCTGPVLRLDGIDEELENISFNTNRHPRTAAAVISPTCFVLIVVDGRFPQAQGMSLFELQKILRWMGARDAINLDGGGSSTMYVRTHDPKKNVVNYPSDNEIFDNKGERPVANALIINSLQ